MMLTLLVSAGLTGVSAPIAQTAASDQSAGPVPWQPCSGQQSQLGPSSPSLLAMKLQTH